ncbi:MAG: hypothetical protein ACRDKV_03140 [Solirubrobacterales bacterium]
MFQSTTWPLRKLGWTFEEKVIWRTADAIRRRPARTRAETEYIPAQSDLTTSAAPVSTGARTGPRLRLPSLPRLRASSRDVSIALATVAVAVGGGIGVATMLGGDDGAGSAPAGTGTPAAAQPPASGDPAAAQPDTLQGVTPNFKEALEIAQADAAALSAGQASPTEDTNSKPSSIPPAATGGGAMTVARDFAGAFVLYEVGRFDADVRKTFARTATPSLATALRERPPRLPDSVQVPTAKVQNVVLGAPRGRRMDASVSLLRLGDISELRLSLTRRKGEWMVSEVRG